MKNPDDSNQHFHGVTDSEEVHSSELRKDTPSSFFILLRFFSSFHFTAATFFISLVLYVAPSTSGLSEILAIISIIFCFFAFFCRWFISIFFSAQKSKTENYPFRSPKSKPLNDDRADGIIFFGNDKAAGKEIWFSNSDVRKHILLFGTTGAGKTEALLGLLLNPLVQGSGFISIDGKGTNEYYSKVLSLVRYVLREDDVLLVNYMTDGKDVGSPKPGDKPKSNTFNPFAANGSSALSEFLISLLSQGDQGSQMWEGRARAFVVSLIRVLVFLRDCGDSDIDCSIGSLRHYIELNNVCTLLVNKSVPDKMLAALRSFIANIPGMDKASLEKLLNGEPITSQTVLDQYGYVIISLTEIINLLTDDYGYIFDAPKGDIDFFDVVANRRIVIVLIPSLSKSAGSLQNLGKIIVASIKNAMSSSMGSDVVGHRVKIIDSRPTSAPTPYLIVLDEYGYYAVENTAVIPAQARGLGFCMVFAGQDYPSFKKANENEAASIVANTGIKICMGLEDPSETADIFLKSVGEAKVKQLSGFEVDKNSPGAYVERGEVSIEKEARVSVRDLRDQVNGEAHLLFGDSISRMRTFYTAIDSADDNFINTFIDVSPVKVLEDKIPVIQENLLTYLSGEKEFDKLSQGGLSSSLGIKNFARQFEEIKPFAINLSPIVLSIASIGLYFNLKRSSENELFSRKIESGESEDIDIDDNLKVPAQGIVASLSLTKEKGMDLSSESTYIEYPDDDDDDDDDDEHDSSSFSQEKTSDVLFRLSTMGGSGLTESGRTKVEEAIEISELVAKSYQEKSSLPLSSRNSEVMSILDDLESWASEDD